MKKAIVEAGTDLLTVQNPLVDYHDGEVAILDNVKGLQNIDSMKLDLDAVILCTKGHKQLEMGVHPLLLHENDVIVCPHGVILDNYMISPDFECKILCLSEHIMRQLLRANAKTWETSVYINRQFVFTLEPEHAEQFQLYYALIRSKINHKQMTYQKETIQSLLQALLLDLTATMQQNEVSKGQNDLSHKKQIFQQFLNLLTSTEPKRQTVRYYASQLNITPKYLSNICKEYSDKSPLKWIEQYVLDDIRYDLKNTDMTIKEIANHLGFCNLAFFGSFVRHHFGVSPKYLRCKYLAETPIKSKD